jgi:FkbM family methyltransferase
MVLSSVLRGFNDAKLWRRRVRVWDRTVKASSLDRLVYLLLHRNGLMGLAERRLFNDLIDPGMHIVDIGANIGLYTLLLAQLTGPDGRVYAFEPEPTLFRTLRRNCLSNGATQVTTVNCALGCEPGRVTFYRSIFNSGDNRLGSFGWQGQGLEVAVARLDDVLPSHCIDFIKIDVQGYEGQVLAGMDKVFAASPRLCIYLEFWPYGLRAAGTQPQEILDHLLERGFRLHHCGDDGPVEITGFGSLEKRLPGKKQTNLLACRTS